MLLLVAAGLAQSVVSSTGPYRRMGGRVYPHGNEALREEIADGCVQVEDLVARYFHVG